MSLLEGYSNHVMNDAGERLLPGFAKLHERFERRNEARGALERAIMRLTGLDLKMEQYAAGERFVVAVLAARDRAFLNQVWEGPANLPDLDRDPRPAALDRPDRGARRPRSSSAEPTRSSSWRRRSSAPRSRPNTRRRSRRCPARGWCRCRARGWSTTTPRRRSASARVLLRGGVPASVLEHIIARAPRLEWIHSFSAGVDRVATPAVGERA